MFPGHQPTAHQQLQPLLMPIALELLQILSVIWLFRGRTGRQSQQDEHHYNFPHSYTNINLSSNDGLPFGNQDQIADLLPRQLSRGPFKTSRRPLEKDRTGRPLKTSLGSLSKNRSAFG